MISYNRGYKKMMETYKYDPLVENIYYLKNKKKIVFIQFSYGSILCTDLNGKYVDVFEDNYRNEKKYIKCGRLIRPRWEKFQLEWVSKGYSCY